MPTTTRTPDLQLAATLWALGHQPAIEGTGPRKIFTWADLPATLFGEYHSGLIRVEPRALFDYYWRLRQITTTTTDDGGRRVHRAQRIEPDPAR